MDCSGLSNGMPRKCRWGASDNLMSTKALKWYAKRLIRRYSPDVVSQRLLGRTGPTYHLWSIGIVTGSSPTRLRHTDSIKNPVLTREHVTDVRALFVADPFMIQVGDMWHMLEPLT